MRIIYSQRLVETLKFLPVNPVLQFVTRRNAAVIESLCDRYILQHQIKIVNRTPCECPPSGHDSYREDVNAGNRSSRHWVISHRRESVIWLMSSKQMTIGNKKIAMAVAVSNDL